MQNQRHVSFLGICAAAFLGMSIAEPVLAVAPNPLQSAYWRFEEGTNFTLVDSSTADPVLDSINENHLDAFNTGASPLYTSVVPPTPLQSGASNNLALDFVPNNDLYTLFQDGQDGKGAGKSINNGYLEPGGGFTLEAAFNPRVVGGEGIFQTIAGKEGRPAEGDLGGAFEENLPTLALKIRDTGQLQIEQWDAAQNLVSVTTESPLNTNQWYYTAVVNDGSQLSLYLDSNDGNGYQLLGSTDVSGALFQGDNPEEPDWGHSWTIGRGQFGGGPADWFDGIIDEVRLTNTALAPSEFLFAPEVEPLLGDYNNDGFVNLADYTLWRDNLGGSGLPNDPTPETVDQSDYVAWVNAFRDANSLGAGFAVVPEPATAMMCGLAFVATVVWRRIPKRHS
jgi:hypothetical protein